MPPRQVPGGVGGEALRDRGHADRPRPSHVGLLGSGRALGAGESRPPHVPDHPGEHTRGEQSLDPPGPAARACRLRHVTAPHRVRYGPVSLRRRARSGGATRLTGPPRAQPAWRARQGVERCVRARGGAQRPWCPAPVAWDWTAAPAPREAARVVARGRVRPLPRACNSLANGTRAAIPVPRTVRGSREVSRA